MVEYSANSPSPKSTDLAIIQSEFEQVQDYRLFMLNYYQHPHEEIVYLVALADWKTIHQEQGQLCYYDDLQGFVNRYKDNTQQNIKHLVVKAMCDILINKYQTIDETFYVYCNDLIQQVNLLTRQTEDEYICLALCYSYWYKAQAIQQKDLFKAQYFYQKVKHYANGIVHQQRLIYLLRIDISLLSISIINTAQNTELPQHISQYAQSQYISQLSIRSTMLIVQHDWAEKFYDVLEQYEKYLEEQEKYKYKEQHKAQQKNQIKVKSSEPRQDNDLMSPLSYQFLNQAEAQENYLHLELKKMVDIYINHQFDLTKSIKNNIDIVRFLYYLQAQEQLKKVLLDKTGYISHLIFIQLAFLYWSIDEEEESTLYLLKYFSIYSSDEEVIIWVIQRYYFTTDQEMERWISYAGQSFNKYTQLEKYRHLFKVKK